ncbi:hypothetical protein ALC56_02359 [Trachymyrmex septentrionalis]|uniref:Uncharacterized protein n=1 Tax=Trachymyrmex septentrionalis TaxID=34720 RepID=A0A195FSA8_9HYME|nr:hypothetical protein ALC56_02359 [Trachymyrmex septentrionalis]
MTEYKLRPQTAQQQHDLYYAQRDSTYPITGRFEMTPSLRQSGFHSNAKCPVVPFVQRGEDHLGSEMGSVEELARGKGWYVRGGTPMRGTRPPGS